MNTYIHKNGDCVGWFKYKGSNKFLQGTCIICFNQQNPNTRLLHRPKHLSEYINASTKSTNTTEYCIYLGKVLDRLDVKGQKCGCKGYWLHECEIHKICTLLYKRDGVKCCRGCQDNPDNVETLLIGVNRAST